MQGTHRVAKRNLVPALRASFFTQASLHKNRPRPGTSFSAALAVIRNELRLQI